MKNHSQEIISRIEINCIVNSAMVLNRCEKCMNAITPFLYCNNKDKIPEEIESRINVSDAFSSIMEVLKCSLCYYTCLRKESLKVHVDSIHSKEKHPCEQCDYTANTRKYLLVHIRTIKLFSP